MIRPVEAIQPRAQQIDVCRADARSRGNHGRRGERAGVGDERPPLHLAGVADGHCDRQAVMGDLEPHLGEWQAEHRFKYGLLARVR
ncbi:hypothetical protein [Streptomyces pinistramenti]|uniref:hypothetical protein n=1 Tax=Streptomyces pinistramenti TaxID=2884812 RepID=UPI001D08067E|nr:hypothetical protein [Streptomyces pinistramenti]MCB5910822.1 hypothetical protein [Streptomyces pinistramenti]